ncbi:MAG: 3-oxoacyl-[acyl-carrier-protein] synthase III C-terminal domain-containing protein, partial [Myxococcota bacterium]|nr:3-oxoacyl-[acyl-carrier-protein] synthase III C-terminal domain-containing protein [Myxococcota bacterium]
AWATEAALNQAGYTADMLDLIIFASAGPEQGLPDTAPLIQAKLGLGSSGIACFSVDSTCLSFITAMDIASCFLAQGRYKRIAIVCSEIASVSLDPNDEKTFTLFGDAATSVILERTPLGEKSAIQNVHFSTFGDGAAYTQVRGCGTKQHANNSSTTFTDNTFMMRGRELLLFTMRVAPTVLNSIWPGLREGLNDIALVMPHQPSRVGMQVFSRYFPEDKMIKTLAEYGNCVSVSLPLALHFAIQNKRLNRGDRALLIGTGAGVSIGGVVFDY